MNTPLLPKALSRTPLVVQIWALLLGGLVVAQLVTMLLTLMLPPEPKAQHGLADVAAALRGQMPVEDRPDHLERSIQLAPPDLSGAIWLASETSRQQLADQLKVNAADVRLAFYAPLPFAGTATASSASQAQPQHPAPIRASLLPVSLALFQMPSGGFPGGMPGGGMPPPSFPQPAPSMPPPPTQSAPPPASAPAPLQTQLPPPPAPSPTQAPQPQQPPSSAPPPPNGQQPKGPAPSGGPSQPQPASLPVDTRTIQSIDPAPVAPASRRAPSAEPIIRSGAPATPTTISTVAVQTPRTVAEPTASLQAPAQVPVAAEPVRADDLPRRTAAAQPAPAAFAPPRSRGLFGLAPAPNLEGYFVAALRLPNGRWAVVHPAPEPFPNAWQRRVLLWFLLAFAVVAPIGWWFARGIVKPLSRFAYAAEQLGRDPNAQVLELQGPAEVGRAARAFNLMQIRLRSYVDDRTAMIGAISHDLRTPLTRLRFRLEEIEDEGVREGMVGEVEEMESMIASVLDFLRGASAQGVREVANLGDVVADVVRQDSRSLGQVVLLESDSAFVEVDRLGIRRVIANLLENAIKYGERAHVRVRSTGTDALLEVIDSGPGLHDEDLERAFEPFYRSADPTLAAKSGTGLGLAICRSIARAHGGDVRLLRSEEGFTAQLCIPLVCEQPQLEAA